MKHRRWLAAFMLLFVACSSSSSPLTKPTPTGSKQRSILLFTRTKGFVHSSIPDAVSALEDQLTRAGVLVEATTDPGRFTDAGLARYSAVVFLLTTGDVLNNAQQDAFEGFIRRGGGFAGVHSAADTEYAWPWFHELLGATFKHHPKPQEATLHVADRDHLSTTPLPEPWTRTDEWYDFRAAPAGIHVLVTVDEKTYTGGTMGANHPISWCRSAGGEHSWYTAMGHSSASWHDATFLAHVTGGILSVAATSPCG